MQEQREDKSKEDHRIVLETAQDAINIAGKNLQAGRERLQNALKRYEERGKLNGPSKLI